jgi:hypothetical protein
MFQEKTINLLNHTNINQEKKNETKEINFNNISKINYIYNALKIKEKNYYLHHKQTQSDNSKIFQNLKSKFNKLKIAKIKYNDIKKNEKLNIKDFTRNIFVNYSLNTSLFQNNIEKDDLTEINDLTSSSSFQKDNQISDFILGIKSKRNLENETETNNFELKKELIEEKNSNKDLIEEKNSIVSFTNGIIRIRKKEIDDSVNNEKIQSNIEVNFFLTNYSI